MANPSRPIAMLHDNFTINCAQYVMDECVKNKVSCVAMHNVDSDSVEPEKNIKMLAESYTLCGFFASLKWTRDEERCDWLNKQTKKHMILVLDKELDNCKNPVEQFRRLKDKKHLLHRIKCCSLYEFDKWKEEEKQKLAKELLELFQKS